MGVIVDLCDKVLRLYNFCTQDVAAGILYDDRSKDVLPQKASLRKHSMQPFLIKISSQICVAFAGLFAIKILQCMILQTPSVAAGSQSTSTTHFSCRRNIVGRLCIRPTIVFLILSNQKARVRSITSRRLEYR